MNQDWTDIIVVLDRSGSMGKIKADTIGGFNTFLQEQRELPGKATLTLVQFNTAHHTVYAGVDIKEAPELTTRTFSPAGGTALLDAMGSTINSTGARLAAMPEELRPGKVIMVIITDGEENSSQEFGGELGKTLIKSMITRQTETYKWAFLFLGANMDAVSVGAEYGLGYGSTITTSASPLGARRMYTTASNTVRGFRAGAKAEFTERDRQLQQEAEEAVKKAQGK